jgi:hypothetical protein
MSGTAGGCPRLAHRCSAAAAPPRQAAPPTEGWGGLVSLDRTGDGDIWGVVGIVEFAERKSVGETRYYANPSIRSVVGVGFSAVYFAGHLPPAPEHAATS